MKLPLSLCMLAITGFFLVPAAMAGQQGKEVEWGQKARPDPVTHADQAQSGDNAKLRTVGVCHPSPNNNYSLDNVIEPIGEAGFYLESFEYRTPPASGTAAILQAPKHGVLRLVTQTDVGTILEPGGDPVDPAAALYLYLPDSSYIGNDTAIIQVDFGNGLKVNVKYYFQAISDAGIGGDWMDVYCSKKGVYWKISSTLDANATALSVPSSTLHR